MAKSKKINLNVFLLDSFIGFFVAFIFFGNLISTMTEPFIVGNIGKIITGSLVIVAMWWVINIFVKRRNTLF